MEVIRVISYFCTKQKKKGYDERTTPPDYAKFIVTSIILLLVAWNLHIQLLEWRIIWLDGQSVLKMKKIIDLYFYIASTFRSNTPSMLCAIAGFSIPVLYIVLLAKRFLEKVFIIKIQDAVSVAAIGILLCLIWLFYKKNDRGKMVVAYYNQTRLRKWYIVLLLGFVYYVCYTVIFFALLKLVDLMC